MDCMRDQFKKGTVLYDRFETIAPLNNGSFGMVFLAKDLQTGKQVAVKCIDQAAIEEASTPGSESCDELECHARLGNHRNIVNLITSFETKTHVFLVLEYCPMGDLYEAIRTDRGPLETENVRDFMLQLIDAVEYMHSKGLYHRDIKPENIFLTHDGDVKLGDFGLATTRPVSFEACVGSDRYMAPEQFEPPATGYSPAKADIWSIGICLLNVLFAKNPFVTPTPSDVLFADYTRDRKSLFDVFPNMSQDTFEVLTVALALDPQQRSIPALREAIMRAVSFSTDDDILDDFCTEDRDLAGTTADREPLRTPSIQSPAVGQGESFPWTRELQKTSQKGRLSPIPDQESYSEDLFAPSENELGTSWYTDNPGTSIPSTYGSSVNSLKSSAVQIPGVSSGFPPKANPAPVSESAPVRPRLIPTMSQVFGKGSEDIYSKSWSDLWDEEEELEQLAIRERQLQNARTYSHDSISGDKANSSGSDSEELSSSPGTSPEMSPILAEVSSSDVNARSATPKRQLNAQSSPIPTPRANRNAKQASENQLAQRLQHHVAAASPSSALKASVPRSPPKEPSLDQWAALGNRRRNASNRPHDKTPTATSPSKPIKFKKKTTGTAPSPSPNLLSMSWRQGPPLPASWATGYDHAKHAQEERQRQVNHHYGTYNQHHQHHNQHHHLPLDHDWRHDRDACATIKPRKSNRPAIDYWAGTHNSDEEFDFVGGWQDLHI